MGILKRLDETIIIEDDRKSEKELVEYCILEGISLNDANLENINLSGLDFGFPEHSSNVIIFQGDYDLYEGNVKRIVDDLYFELSREKPNTRRVLKDLIKDCKIVSKFKVNDK